MNILNQIISYKIKELKQLKKTRPLESFINDVKPSEIDFKTAIIDRSGLPALIAEIKQASPSAGVIRPNIDGELEQIVKIYSDHAAAISVLTDEHFFQGNFDRLRRIRAMTNLPLLCKDFIIDEYQVYQARNAGADAVLLIVSAFNVIANGTKWSEAISLDSKQRLLRRKLLAMTIKAARSLNMPCLVETRTAAEIKTALSCGAEIIGINNRDLTTFEVNIDITLELLKYISSDIVTVSESGFRSADDIKRMTGKVDAVLIGTELMKSQNIASKISNLGL